MLRKFVVLVNGKGASMYKGITDMVHVNRQCVSMFTEVTIMTIG